MKKLSIKIKSIYTLTAVLVLSLCMLLFPATSKPASAEEIAEAASSITVNSVYVQVANDVEENPEFALMFNAKITLQAYNTITNNGQDNVKFGMLIGKTEQMINVSDYQTAIDKDFVAIANVGTRSSGTFQQVDFRLSEEYTYSAGIRYDKAYLEAEGQKQGKTISLKDVANMELTAIPFYTINQTSYAIMDNQKNCLPREILAESFIKEQDDEVDNIPVSVVKAYVGEVQEMPGEHYICRDSARFMTTNVVGGDLNAVSLATSEDTVYVSGKNYSSLNTLEIGSDLLDTLPMYSKTNVVVYKADGSIQKYATKIAERVITRFADTTVGTEATDTTKDYLAKAGESTYESIFKITSGSVKFKQGSKEITQLTDRSFVYRSMSEGYEGLYVLGKNISLPSSHNYVVDTGAAYNTSIGFTNQNSGADNDRAKVAYVTPIAYVGFNGIFDGRGHSVDMQTRAVNGVFPSAFDATIKNTAFYGLSSSVNGGGITYHARLTNFENIYAELTKATNHNADLNKGLLMNVQDCDFVNFVANVNAITSSVMTDTLPTYQLTTTTKIGSGVGQGVTTSGVFSFKAYPDFYYDSTNNQVVSALTEAQFTGTGANAGKFFIDKIALSEVQRLFKNMINKDGKAIWSLYNTAKANFNTTAPLSADYFTMGDNSQATAFTGSTGVNVYAVGSSPLYIGYDYKGEVYTASGSTTEYLGTQLGATSSATVFVNEAPTLTAGGQAEVNWRVDENKYVAPKAYKMSEIAGDMFAFVDDTTYSLGEIIYRGKLFRHGATRMSGLLGTNSAKDVLEVKFINQEGFYDVASMDDMKSYVLAQETPFDSQYWNVGTDGSVAWKNPIVK